MKYFTLDDIVGLVKADNGWTGTTSYDERIKAAARKAVGELERKADFDWTVRQGEIAMVASQELFACPYDFRKEVEGTVKHGTSKMVGVDMAEIARRREGEGIKPGTPKVYCVSGLWPVHTQPSAASTISLVSDSGADTLITVTIRGVVDGITRYEEVAVTSTTTVDSTLQYTELFALSKASASTGVISAYIGSTEIVAIPPQAMEMAFRVFRPEAIPDAVATVSFDYYRNLGAMLQMGEAMPVPSGFEDVMWSRMSMYVDRFRRDYEAHRLDAAAYLGAVDELVGEKREPTGLTHPRAR